MVNWRLAIRTIRKTKSLHSSPNYIYIYSSSPLVYFLFPIVMHLKVVSLSILTWTITVYLPNPSINHISAFHKHSPHKTSFSPNLRVLFLHFLLLCLLTVSYWLRTSSPETSIFYFSFLQWVKTKKKPSRLLFPDSPLVLLHFLQPLVVPLYCMRAFSMHTY